MFTDECNCDDNDGWDTREYLLRDCGCEKRGDSPLPQTPLRRSHFQSSKEERGSHYQSPKEVDGDYSYAYSDSVSPAFLIRMTASQQEYEDETNTENIYEEINETNKSGSGESIRSIFQRAKQSVRRSSKNMEDLDSSFHMSISKGRKQTLIERANVDWDNEGEKEAIEATRSSPSGDDTQDDSGFHSGGVNHWI